MKTFYLAGPSSIADKMRMRINTLRRLNYICACDWTQDVPKFGASGLEQSDLLQRAGMVCSDIAAVQCSDLFVACITAEPTSRGTYMEIGARIATGRRVHIVLDNGPGHLFFHHPLVSVWLDWETFLGQLQAANIW